MKQVGLKAQANDAVSQYAREHNIEEREAALILAVENGEIRSGVVYDENGDPLPKPERSSRMARMIRQP